MWCDWLGECQRDFDWTLKLNYTEPNVEFEHEKTEDIPDTEPNVKYIK